jgi:hypothetical protein
MSTIQTSLSTNFMNEEKREVLKDIYGIMEKSVDANARVKGVLEVCKKSFLEELPIDTLKFLLILEKAWVNDTIGDVLLIEGLKRGFI